MMSSVSNDINLDQVDGEINSILNDIKNIFDQEMTGINIGEVRIDRGQLNNATQKLMQVF